MVVVVVVVVGNGSRMRSIGHDGAVVKLHGRYAIELSQIPYPPQSIRFAISTAPSASQIAY